MRNAVIGVLGAGLICTLAHAQPCGRAIQSVNIPVPFGAQVALAGHPTDPSVIFTLSLSGRVTVVRNGVASPTPALTVANFGSSNAGYGFACDPDFERNGHIYVFGPVNVVGSLPISAVMRFTRSADNPDLFDPASRTVVLRVQSQPVQHTGGWLGFSPDGLLYIALGDHFQEATSRQPTNFLGKLLRIDVRTDAFPNDPDRTYSIPPGNPFPNGPFLSEVFATGFRNPFRSGFDRSTSDLFLGDVGAGAFEEVNLIRASSPGGQNFGWPCFEGFVEQSFGCSAPRPNSGTITFPLVQVSTTLNRCIIGGPVYRGSAIPWLRGRYIYGSCQGGSFFQFDPGDPYATRRSLTIGSGIYGFGEDASGELYIVGPSGLQKLVDAPPPAVDCNRNLISDTCEINTRAETDYNANRVPDSCERVCIADWNLSGVVDQADIDAMVSIWMRGDLAADIDRSDVLSVKDLFDFLNIWLAGCR